MIDTVTVDGFTSADIPTRFEAGTPPIVEAIGLAAAIDYLQGLGMEQIAKHEKELAAIAHQRIGSIDGLTILGPSADLTCGIVSFSVEGVSAQDISVLLDIQGVAIRAGHHCTMPLHNHLGIPASCRASFYAYNTVDEVNRFADILIDVLAKLR